MKKSRLIKGIAVILGALTMGIMGLGFIADNVTGAPPQGERLARIRQSPHQQNGIFFNDLPEKTNTWEAAKAGLFQNSRHSLPKKGLPPTNSPKNRLAEPPQTGLRVTWFGHSTLLVEIDNACFLLDPVWGERVSPFSMIGPRRFHQPVMAIADLPALDAVLISHDHYDHLDYPAVMELAKTQVPFIVPLGVGSHLEHWGIPKTQIIELDWWGEQTIADVRLVATPARHFSGRSIFMKDRNHTLWSGWALIGPQHRAWYSGDTAMFPGFKEIGRRLGPFDVTMIESGAYNAAWADVHLGPEQAVDAHRMVGGDLMIPVHWGSFRLAPHGWTEPIERILARAEKLEVRVATPRIGDVLEPEQVQEVERWWPKLDWQSVEEAPIVSSGLQDTAQDESLTPLSDP